MRTLERRIGALEASQRGAAMSLAHLSDAEVEARMFGVIDRLRAHGIPLPADSREMYAASPEQFGRAIEPIIKEAMECVA